MDHRWKLGPVTSFRVREQVSTTDKQCEIMGIPCIYVLDTESGV